MVHIPKGKCKIVKTKGRKVKLCRLKSGRVRFAKMPKQKK